MVRAVRALLAAVLVAAQFAGGSLAAQATAQGAPCPVQAALASDHDRTSAHQGHHGYAEADGHAHGSRHDRGDSEDEDSDASAHFSFACCAACAAAMTATDALLQAPGWLRQLPLPATHGLEPGELPSTDPPPRVLL